MPGSLDLDGIGTIDATDAAYVAVFGADGTLYPNLVPVTIDVREGPEPAGAVLRYELDSSGLTPWPSRAEQIWPLGSQGPYVVQQDDQVVIAIVNPDGSLEVLFHGFAQAPQMDLTPGSEHVSFTAVQVSARVWDAPIVGRVQRSAVHPEDTSGKSDVAVTALPCRFNPSSQGPGATGGVMGNATSYQYYTVNSDVGNFPVFLDPLVYQYDAAHGVNFLDPWKISGALKYVILYRLLVQLGGASDWVTWPDLDTLHALLQVVYPAQGSDLLDPSTWQVADAVIRDYDASGKAIPRVVSDLLAYAGFLVCWQTTTASDGSSPVTYLKIYRRDAGATMAPKTVYYPVEGDTIDYSTGPATSLSLNRDSNAVANAYVLETRPKLIEVTVQLAPLFQPEVDDWLAVNRRQFAASSWTGATTAEIRRKYRWYGADEGGDGHYNGLLGSWEVGQPIDWTPVFPRNSDKTPSYVDRYRPGGHRVIARDSDGRPLHAVLEISLNNQSGEPLVQQGPSSETWIPVTGGWRLLPDRFGIEVTVEDPEQWNGGKGVGDIRGITWPADPDASGSQPFTLRLTTVVESDQDMGITAPKRTASPTQWSRVRSADARDHFQYCAISPGSINYTQPPGDGTKPIVVRDDTAPAQTHANQLRSKGELPPISGTVRIPYITTYYEVGDRISYIDGRGISLITNIAIDQGEAPCFAWIVGITWGFERQETVLHLSHRHHH